MDHPTLLLELTGDIWTYHDHDNWIVIPTNGDVNRQGLAVMGRGVALQVANRYPEFRKEFADLLTTIGNRVIKFPQYAMFTFPVKHHWHEAADLTLIERSAYELVNMPRRSMVYLPRVGCGNGRLSWSVVRPVLERAFGDEVGGFTVVSLPGGGS